jgi:ABC-type branched-subunit amino acid transport system ATPase component
VAEARYEQPHRIFSERTVFKRHEDEIRHYLDYFGLTDPTTFAMSAGEKKVLDIIRCLLLKPAFLLLDEPTAGLPEDLTEKVMTVVRDLAASGTSVVIVEHDLNLIWSLCDEVLFMAEGSVVLRGDAPSIRANRTVVEKYLGEGHV